MVDLGSLGGGVCAPRPSQCVGIPTQYLGRRRPKQKTRFIVENLFHPSSASADKSEEVSSVVGSLLLSASLPICFRLTFWPMFYHPRNYIRNQAEIKTMWGNAARLFAPNVDARLAGIVI